MRSFSMCDKKCVAFGTSRIDPLVLEIITSAVARFRLGTAQPTTGYQPT